MLHEIVNSFKQIHFDQIFILDAVKGKEYSYSAFFSRALHLAYCIDAQFMGNAVIAIKENSVELALLYFAIMLTDKKIIVIDPQKGNEEIKELLDCIDSAAIFCDDNEILQLPNGYVKLSISDESVNLKDIELRAIIIEKIQKRNMGAPYLVTFTSGTSGLTKGVEHSLRNLFLAAFALDEKVKKRNGCFLHVMPMTYMAGILNSLIYPFVSANMIVIASRFSIMSARFFWDVVTKYDVNLFWLSPTMLRIIDQLDKKNIGEDYCRDKHPTILVGTAPLLNDMRERFNTRYGVTVYSSYGLSETLFISVETPDSIQHSKVNCVGELLSGVEYSITLEGELLVEVPWMFLRYTNEDTKRYFLNGYYKTGDLVEINNEYVYIKGRCKDLIIKGGMNISPVKIENIINSIPAILECAAVGVKDDDGEEKICCVYVVDGKVDDLFKLEAMMQKIVLEKLGKHYSIDYMWRVDEIPCNINGKIDRKAIIQSWGETKLCKNVQK